jgi:hypothetical protein
MSSAVLMNMKSVSDWSTREKVLKLIDVLNSHPGVWLPTKYDLQEPVRLGFNSENQEDFINVWLSDAVWPILKRRDPYTLSLSTQWWYQEHHQFNELDASIDPRYFKRQEMIDEVLQGARDLYIWGQVLHGYITHEHDWDNKNYFDTLTEIASGRMVSTGGLSLEEGLPGIYWANFFGPTYTQFFGRTTFLTAPAYHVEELPDGGFLLLTASSPLHYMKEEVRVREKALIEHLGRDAFFEKANPMKKCRVPKLEFQQPSYGRAIEVKAYNPVWEVIPDTRHFLSETTRLAESLVERLKGKLDYSAESLDQLDTYILRKSRALPEPWKEESSYCLLRELAAYYGEVLRRHLQGTWKTIEDERLDSHPIVACKVQGRECIEYPFDRVIKLWQDRNRAYGLHVHFYLVRSGQWQHLEQHLQSLQ